MLEPGPSMVVNAGFDTEYGFADLEPGTYLIGYARGGGDPDEDLVHTSEVIEVTDRIVSHDIRVEPLDRARCLVLWIYGPDGQLVGDATRAMRVGHVHPVNGRFRAATTVRQSDGSFWLLRPPETDAAARRVANGRRILRVGSPEYGEHEVEYAERTTAELTVRFSDPAVLEVVVEGYNPERSGEGIFRVMPHRLDASGMARERRDSRWFPSQTELGASGRTSFRPLEPGEYEVTLSFRAEGQNGDLVLSRTPVTLRPGANETVVNMPPLYTLVVVADAARWARVLLHPRDGANGSTLKKPLGENRSVSFTDLPSGEYRVELKELRLGPDGEAVEHRETGTVHVSGDTEYRF
jgi:hypothetical protein